MVFRSRKRAPTWITIFDVSPLLASAPKNTNKKTERSQKYSCYRAITEQTNKISIRLESLWFCMCSQFLHNLSFSSHLNFSFFFCLALERTHNRRKLLLLLPFFVKWKRTRLSFFFRLCVRSCSFAHSFAFHPFTEYTTRIGWVKMLFVGNKKKNRQPKSQDENHSSSPNTSINW